MTVLRYVFLLYLTNLRILKNFDNFDLFWCYIKQIMTVFIRAMVKFHLSPNEHIFTIARMGAFFTCISFTDYLMIHFNLSFGV